MSPTIISGWRDLAPDLKGAAVALGNFDGVHEGHKQVIAAAARAARALGAPLGVIRFTPHPARIMRPSLPPFLLMNPAQQARALEALGVERVYDILFDSELAHLSPEAFTRDVLAAGIGARHVCAGFDIAYGKDRGGNAASLEQAGQALGFGVTIAPSVQDAEGHKVSSSAARAAVRAGDLDAAARILGRPFAIEGVVERGQQLGRKIGFPTANVSLGDYVRPILGSYATITRLPDGRRFRGVANIGENPTTGLVDARLEVMLFDFCEDIYGQVIETELIAFLRPELYFDTLEGMIVQIGKDADRARALLANRA
jgi:riboflavin kinase/FMN adenylyltransferase